MTYVGMAELGYTDIAQACVYPGSVARSVTASINSSSSSTLYSPTTGFGLLFGFASLDGSSRLEISVAKESDGSFYVTHVSKT
jgi:hypothetical protein